MIFRSNLTAPDLQPYFKHVTSRVMPHSFGHDVLSDWADKSDDDPVFGPYKQCGFLTHDEAAILYNIAWSVAGRWLDIGAHTGWSTWHIRAGLHNDVYPIEPLFQLEEVRRRFAENLSQPGFPVDSGWPLRNGCPDTSDAYFEEKLGAGELCAGVLIDGDHDSPQPLADAENAFAHLTPTGVIVLHDFIGKPVRDAVEYLMSEGMKCRLYWTPYILAVCWRGDFTPPEHHGDPELARILPERVQPFDLGRCV